MACVCEASNVLILDPRWPRREHAIERNIIDGKLSHAAETTYLHRCGITLGDVLRAHGIKPRQLPQTD